MICLQEHHICLQEHHVAILAMAAFMFVLCGFLVGMIVGGQGTNRAFTDGMRHGRKENV